MHTYNRKHRPETYPYVFKLTICLCTKKLDSHNTEIPYILGLGLARFGLAWLGLARDGLAWLGWGWLGLAWLGLVWSGLALLCLGWLGLGLALLG